MWLSGNFVEHTLIEHRGATNNVDNKKNIAEHHLKKYRID